jgi:hypothetical protein
LGIAFATRCHEASFTRIGGTHDAEECWSLKMPQGFPMQAEPLDPLLHQTPLPGSAETSSPLINKLQDREAL